MIVNIDTKHPLYAEFYQDWLMCRDTYRGERVVKDRGETYLPPTAGMVKDGMTMNATGWHAYEAYKKRAIFPPFMSDAVRRMMGILHCKPAKITLPSALEPLRLKCTPRGETLEHLLRRINMEQLVVGRIGAILDMPTTPDPANPLPYIATYNAEHIINWDEGGQNGEAPRLNFVVLDESSFVRQTDFSWQWIEKYRVLSLNDVASTEVNGQVAVYKTGLFKKGEFSEELMLAPNVRGRTLDAIPFQVINSIDVAQMPEDPPLLGLARTAMAVYRGEADYRQNLFMQGQDTLVVIGSTVDEDEEMRIGAGATIGLPQGGDAKFIGVSAAGLSEQRSGLEGLRRAAKELSGQMAESTGREQESGESRKVRVGAQTASFKSVALSGGAGLEALLKLAARWVGANEDEVKVEPNLDFDGEEMGGETLVQLMTARSLGAPISKASIHDLMKTKGLTKMDYEAEIKLIEEEGPDPAMEGDDVEEDDAEAGGEDRESDESVPRKGRVKEE